MRRFTHSVRFGSTTADVCVLKIMFIKNTVVQSIHQSRNLWYFQVSFHTMRTKICHILWLFFGGHFEGVKIVAISIYRRRGLSCKFVVRSVKKYGFLHNETKKMCHIRNFCTTSYNNIEGQRKSAPGWTWYLKKNTLP